MALLDRLTDLGDRVDIYGPRDTARGGIIASNLRDRRGQILLLRASLGIPTNAADLDRLTAMIAEVTDAAEVR